MKKKTSAAALRRAGAAALALCLLGAASACASSSGASSSNSGSSGFTVDSAPTSLFDGDQVTNPFAKPDVTLTDTEGKPFNLVAGTAGKLTLLYFGYTHCPDVCPTTMADIAAALRALPAAESGKISVIFVSTDPTRDTPAVLHSWLAQFNPDFIGLTGSFATIQRAASALGIPVSPPTTSADGDYTVTHGAEVLAFNTDDKAHVVFTAGTSVSQYDHDLRLLLAGTDMKSSQ
jgi:protein SCO1